VPLLLGNNIATESVAPGGRSRHRAGGDRRCWQAAL